MKKAISILLFMLLFLSAGSVAFAEDVPNITGSAHVQDVGWTSPAPDGNHLLLGTVGQGRRIEAYTLNTDYPGLGFSYQAHVEDIGWQDPSGTGQVAGTEGQGKRVEAFRVSLTGENAGNFTLYYRTHVQDYGWLDWTTGGASAGTTNHAFRCEALELLVVPAGTPAPGATTTPAVEAVTREEALHMVLVNQFRKANGLNYVTGDPNLHAVAALRAQELPVRYSHYRPDGSYYTTAVKSVFPNYRLNAGGFMENICFGTPTCADPVRSYAVITMYPHQQGLILQDGAKFMSWVGHLSNGMGYSVEAFSGLDRIDFAD